MPLIHMSSLDILLAAALLGAGFALGMYLFDMVIYMIKTKDKNKK